MLGLRHSIFDVELDAGVVEGARPEQLASRHGALDLVDGGAGAARIGEVETVVREDGVVAVGDGRRHGAQEVAGNACCRLLRELDEGELRHPVDRDEEVELAFRRPHPPSRGQAAMSLSRLAGQTPAGQGMWKKPSA